MATRKDAAPDMTIPVGTFLGPPRGNCFEPVADGEAYTIVTTDEGTLDELRDAHLRGGDGLEVLFDAPLRLRPRIGYGDLDRVADLAELLGWCVLHWWLRATPAFEASSSKWRRAKGLWLALLAHAKPIVNEAGDQVPRLRELVRRSTDPLGKAQLLREWGATQGRADAREAEREAARWEVSADDGPDHPFLHFDGVPLLIEDVPERVVALSKVREELRAYAKVRTARLNPEALLTIPLHRKVWEALAPPARMNSEQLAKCLRIKTDGQVRRAVLDIRGRLGRAAILTGGKGRASRYYRPE